MTEAWVAADPQKRTVHDTEIQAELEARNRIAAKTAEYVVVYPITVHQDFPESSHAPRGYDRAPGPKGRAHG